MLKIIDHSKNLHDAIIALVVWVIFVAIVIPGLLYLTKSFKKKID